MRLLAAHGSTLVILFSTAAFGADNQLASVLRDLVSPDQTARISAEQELAVVFRGEEIMELVRQSEDGDVRAGAARALGLHSDAASSLPGCVDVLKGALSDEVERVRSQAALALGALGPESASAIPDLIRALEEGGTESEVLGALADIGAPAPGAVQLALRFLASSDSLEREEAARALGVIVRPPDDSAVSERLGRLLADECLTVAEAAARSLSRLGQVGLEQLMGGLGRRETLEASLIGIRAMRGGARRAVPALEQRLLRAEDPLGVQVDIAHALYVVSGEPGPVLLALQGILNSSSDRQVRIHALLVIAEMKQDGELASSTLVQCCRDPDPAIRRHAVAALGQVAIRSTAVMNALNEALHDTDGGVQQAAQRSLQVLDDRHRR